LIYHEEDALHAVDSAYELFDPAPVKMTLDDVLAWGLGRETGDVVCSDCDHMLSKDD
jgi:hypothetical protein